MTKLEAVQEVLRRNGMEPGPALDPTGPSMMGKAERILDAEELAIQTRGWHYNTKYNVEVSPSLYTFTGADWTALTRTLTSTGDFADAWAGQTLTLSGTGVTAGDYVVESVTSDDAVVLTTSCAAGNLSGAVAGEAQTNAIELPSGIIRIDTDGYDYWRDLTQRGPILLDKDDNVTMFDDSVRVTYVERLGFGCIPQAVQYYIAMSAALTLSETFGDPQRRGVIAQALNYAKSMAMSINSGDEDANIFNNPASLRHQGRRLWRYWDPSMIYRAGG